MSRPRLRPVGGMVVLLTWLVLNASLSPGHLVFGAFLGIALPALLGGLWPEDLAFRRPLRALRLLLVLLGDIVLANLEVAVRILGPESALRPGFVWLPLDLRNRYAIATLAAMVTLTPGTVSCDISPDRRWLLLHALDVSDPAALVAGIKRRYEVPLAEILE